jgi:hypothetical protein
MALGSQQTEHALRSVECNIGNFGDRELDRLAVSFPALLFPIAAITRAYPHSIVSGFEARHN